MAVKDKKRRESVWKPLRVTPPSVARLNTGVCCCACVCACVLHSCLLRGESTARNCFKKSRSNYDVTTYRALPTLWLCPCGT